MQHGNANEGIATHSPVLWLALNAAEQKPVPAAPPCSPSSTYGDEDDDKSFHKKRNKNYALRASAMATTGASLIDVKAEFAPRPTTTTLLRQSALQADSEHGKSITTMENADVDAIITALAAVIRAYTQEADKKSVPSACFDEQEHPLDSSSCWKQVPCHVNFDGWPCWFCSRWRSAPQRRGTPRLPSSHFRSILGNFFIVFYRILAINRGS